MSWQVLTGVIEWWSDEGLRDIGRLRYHRSRQSVRERDGVPRGTVDTSRAAFVAKRSPWRIAQVALGLPNETSPDVVAWADEATAVLTGSPASQHLVPPNESWGDHGLRRMLNPTPLETLVAKPWPATFRVEGHLLERDMSLLPELVSLATDYYEATYDAELDVLTSWTSFIDGESAHRQTLTHLTDIPPDLSEAPRA
jgi:hypothetical protein